MGKLGRAHRTHSLTPQDRNGVALPGLDFHDGSVDDVKL